MNIIESIPVTIEYAGAVVKDYGWKCDQWAATFTKSGKKWTATYSTGLGLRVGGKPVKPTTLDVLTALARDAEYGRQSFADFCANLGYSDDSISAFETYRECMAIDAKLRQYLTRDQIKAVSDAAADL
jgi:hypothetical protein